MFHRIEKADHYLGARKKTKPFDLGLFLFTRAPIIIILGLLIFVLLLPIMMISFRTYEADGFMLIAKDKPSITDLGGGGELRRVDYFADTHIMLMKGEDTLEQALKEVGNNVPDFLGREQSLTERILRLKKSLHAIHVSNSYFIRVSLSNKSPEKLKDVVNAVMEAHVAKLKKDQAILPLMVLLLLPKAFY